MISALSRANRASTARHPPRRSNAFSKQWIGDHVPRKIDMLSLMSMSDAFFGRVFLARRELVPFGTVSITTYFHTGVGRTRGRRHQPRARGRRRQDFPQELRRPERRIVVAQRAPARHHDANRVFQGVAEHTGDAVVRPSKDAPHVRPRRQTAPHRAARHPHRDRRVAARHADGPGGAADGGYCAACSTSWDFASRITAISRCRR